MLNSEVIFLEFVTGTSDFGGKLLKFFQKKNKQKNATRFFGNLRSVTEGNTTIFLDVIMYTRYQPGSHYQATIYQGIIMG